MNNGYVFAPYVELQVTPLFDISNLHSPQFYRRMRQAGLKIAHKS